MSDYRKMSGTRDATRGQFTKPGIRYPNPSVPSDFFLVENKTVDTKEQPIAYLTAHPTLTAAKLCRQDFAAEENGMKTRTRIYRTLPGAAITQRQWDDSLKSTVEISTQDLAYGTAAPSVVAEPLMLEFMDSPTENGWITRTIVRLPALPSDIVEYKTQNFGFPAILDSLTATVSNVGFGNVRIDEDTTVFLTGVNTVVSVLPVIRPAINLPTVHRITTSFFKSTELPAQDALYSINTNNIRADGQLLRFALGEVLNNAITATATAGTLDSSLAGLSESFSWGASAPSATEYVNDVVADEWKIIASDLVPYRGHIWIRQRTEIKLK